MRLTLEKKSITYPHTTMTYFIVIIVTMNQTMTPRRMSPMMPRMMPPMAKLREHPGLSLSSVKPHATPPIMIAGSILTVSFQFFKCHYELRKQFIISPVEKWHECMYVSVCSSPKKLFFCFHPFLLTQCGATGCILEENKRHR